MRLQSNLQIADLLFLRGGNVLNVIVQAMARFLKCRHRLLQLPDLVSGRHNSRPIHHSQHHVIERVDIARYRKQFARCSRRAIGIFQQAGQGRLQIPLNRADI